MNKSLLLLFILSAFCATTLLGQDIVFIQNGNRLEGKITSVGPRGMSMSINKKDRQLAKGELLLTFFENGDAFVFDPRTPKGYRTFPFDNEYYDKLITKMGRVIPVEQLNDEGNHFRYSHLLEGGPEQKIAMSDIVAVLYRDGSHQLFASARTVANCLLLGHGLVALNGEKPAGVEPISTGEPAEISSISPQTVASNKNPVVNPQPAESTVQEVEMAPEDLPERKRPKLSPKLPVSETEFKQKATARTRELTNYVRRISDKQTGPLEANKAIDQAVKLFVSNKAIVEVSSKNSEFVQRFNIRPYLDHIKLLKYDKVELSWVEINYVGDVRKGTDGNYYGYVTFTQIFK
ncbi:MAG: hypothetical protein AAF206_13020, partial [Bacteroidota bacterium]